MAGRLLIALTLALLGCKSKKTESPPVASADASAPAAPTAAEAAAYVTQVEEEMRDFLEYGRRTSWVRANFITSDTDWLLARVEGEYARNQTKWANGAKPFNRLKVDPELARKLVRIKQSLEMPAPDDAADKLGEVKTRLSTQYSTGKVPIDGEEVDFAGIAERFEKAEDPARLAEVWSAWRRIAVPMKSDYAEMVSIANRGARELGFADMRELWLSQYDMPPDEMAAEVDRLWGQVKPLYDQLHCHVRAKLNAKYGDELVPLDKPIRADLTRNLWAQRWIAIADDVTDGKAGGAELDVTSAMVKAGYTPKKMMETGEAFFVSLGFDKLPATFWERSLFEKPQDRNVVCHASAWSIDLREDLRIKMCAKVTEDNLRVVHHEIGHLIYERAYNELSPLYQAGAHDGFPEALGDFVALSVTPEYLVKIGLLEQAPPDSGAIDHMMRQALDKVAFLPFALVVDGWRWKVFAGEVKPDDYTSAWWELRDQYQGIRRPSAAPADAFDPGSKYHIPANVPYLRYFLAFVLQYQLHAAACKMAGVEGPLHRCSIYGSKEVGEKLAAMLAMGASKPWPEVLEAFTGTRQMDGSALVAYFKPLVDYLEEQNQGRSCGW